MTLPRVVIVGPTPPPHHGMTTATLVLLESPLLRARYELIHLDIADRRGQANMGRLDAGNVWLAFVHGARLAGLLLRRRPRIVYIPISQNRWAYFRDALLIAISRVLGARVVTHLNGGGFRNFYAGTDPVTRGIVRRTSRWLAAAAVLGDGLRPIYRGLVSSERVRVVPNGIEDPFPDRKLSRNGGPPHIGYVGTLMRDKGVFDVIRLAARLRDAGVAARFTVAGAWNSAREREEGEALVRELSLEGRVSFAGVVTGEAKRRLLEELDVFVLPTRYGPEGQPYAILEAMSASLPVVTTARGAIPDMIEDGETGVLVPEGDLEALSDAVERLIARPDLRRELGAAARRRFEQRFTADASVRSLVAVLDEVAGQLPGRTRVQGR